MSITHESRRFDRHRKAVWIVLAAVLTVSVSGFFMGLRQTVKSAALLRGNIQGPEAHKEVYSETVPPAPSYLELAMSAPKDRGEMIPVMEQLPLAPSHEAGRALTEAERKEVIRRRMNRRAYDGAPPVVPHAIDQRSSASCLTCHNQERLIRESITVKMSHPYLTHCIQCHVESSAQSFRWDTSLHGISIKNTFSGKGTSGRGGRAHPLAPPTIPHDRFMRTDCLSCHGVNGSYALKSPHPDRQSCTQCHAPNAEIEGRSHESALLSIREKMDKLLKEKHSN